MKAVKVTTEAAVNVIDITQPFVECLHAIIGGFEIVRPKGLPMPFCMIVDDEGRVKQKPINEVGSFLYEYHKHGHPIAGDIVIVKEISTHDGYDLDGLSESEINDVLALINRICTERGINADG